MVLNKSTPDSNQREAKNNLMDSVSLKRGLTQKPESSQPSKLMTKKAEKPKKKHHGQGQNKKEENNNNDMFDNIDPDKLDWRQMFLQEKMVGEPQSIPQSVIYKLVDETINKDATDLKCPDTGKKWDIFIYILQIPLTHLQYISIPDPLSKRNENYYPLSLVMSIIWIFVYSFIIVWFTYDISNTFNLKFSIIPMFIYPIGISFRDKKKFRDFELCLQVFKKELPDQEITLAETYSP